MTTKLGRMKTSLDALLPIMSHNLLIMWPCERRGSLTGGGLISKRLSCHQLVVMHRLNKIQRNTEIS